MIPKIIHYCWFGRGKMPELVTRCIASWHKFMPDWDYQLWSEDNFDIISAPLYVRQAYEAKKYAFVSDYVRLWALNSVGGLYLDVDFEVYKSFEPLLSVSFAFAGWQGSKKLPVMMGVIASEPHGSWISYILHTYDNRPFYLSNKILDLRPNTDYLTDLMIEQGLICDGVEKDFMGLHIYPVDFFCPTLTTGENIKSENTYCEHKGLNSWAKHRIFKSLILSCIPAKYRIKLIKFKRFLFG